MTIKNFGKYLQSTNLSENTNVTLQPVKFENHGKFVEVQTEAAVEETVNKQYFDSSGYTAKGSSHTYICIHYPPNSPLPSRLPLDIEQSSVCYTVGPC